MGNMLPALLLAVLATACASPEAPSPTVIAPERALALAGAAEAVLVDVRLPQERVDPRVPPHTAAWFPYDRYAPGHFASVIAEAVEGDRSRPVILVCEVGVRSGWAARSLAEAGFTHAMSVDQGYLLWRARGLALVEGQEAPTPELSLD